MLAGLEAQHWSIWLVFKTVALEPPKDSYDCGRIAFGGVNLMTRSTGGECAEIFAFERLARGGDAARRSAAGSGRESTRRGLRPLPSSRASAIRIGPRGLVLQGCGQGAGCLGDIGQRCQRKPFRPSVRPERRFGPRRAQWGAFDTHGKNLQAVGYGRADTHSRRDRVHRPVVRGRSCPLLERAWP